MAVKENEKIAKASQEWEYLRGDEAVKRMAFLKEKWERDWNSSMRSAKEIGMEKGIKEGIKEGIKKGKKEGKIEEKKEIAIKMIHEKIDEEIILKVTNLKSEEIEKIKQELKIKL